MDSNKAIAEAFTELAPRYEKVVDQELRRIWGWSYKEFVDQLLSLTSVNDLVMNSQTETVLSV